MGARHNYRKLAGCSHSYICSQCSVQARGKRYRALISCTLVGSLLNCARGVKSSSGKYEFFYFINFVNMAPARLDLMSLHPHPQDHKGSVSRGCRRNRTASLKIIGYRCVAPGTAYKYKFLEPTGRKEKKRWAPFYLPHEVIRIPHKHTPLLCNLGLESWSCPCHLGRATRLVHCCVITCITCRSPILRPGMSVADNTGHRHLEIANNCL